MQTINLYLDKQNNNVGHDKSTFFIAHRKLFRAANEDTISRWVKKLMTEAGIDKSKYNTHTYRSAASTGALYEGVHREDISEQGNWSNIKKI